MVAKLTNEYVSAKCSDAGWLLESEFLGVKSKLKVRCTECKKPRDIWWAQIRDGQKCTFCTGARIDLLQAFKYKSLQPAQKPRNVREAVNCTCLVCGYTDIQISETDIKRLKNSPCTNCASIQFQSEKQELFFSKGRELYQQFTVREARYLAQCINCGHYSKVHGSTACSKNPVNCTVCRAQDIYMIIGQRLDELGGVLSAPIDPLNLTKKAQAYCLSRKEDRPLSLKDVIYNEQGFCFRCGARARRGQEGQGLDAVI